MQHEFYLNSNKSVLNISIIIVLLFKTLCFGIYHFVIFNIVKIVILNGTKAENIVHRMVNLYKQKASDFSLAFI